MGGPGNLGTILVVDDDADIRRFVEMNLRLEGYRVMSAADGAMALAMASTDVPDLVLLDVMMPGMDGIEVVRRLKSDVATAAIPVILLSAKAQATDISGGLEAGADDYITKPFDPLELLDKVAALIGAAEAPS
jgi:DNA-binding response OmpR family regulator